MTTRRCEGAGVKYDGACLACFASKVEKCRLPVPDKRVLQAEVVNPHDWLDYFSHAGQVIKGVHSQPLNNNDTNLIGDNREAE